jgi:putative transcriptional regulator
MSRIIDEMHESMTGVHEAGLLSIGDMRKFDAACLPVVKQYTPAQIKKIRTRSNASQPVFAKCLNTSPSTARQWESGTKKPSGIARKILSLVDSKGLEILLEA